MDFKIFKQAIAKQFERMRVGHLFRAEVERDVLWETYLAAFPPGTNPIYRERREYDCSCCRHFVKDIGGLVAIKDGIIRTLWDCEEALATEPAYAAVAKKMAELVKAKPIANIFLNPVSVVGVDKTFEQLTDRVATWSHFFVHLPSPYVISKADIGPRLSAARSSYDVMLRSLEELTVESVNTALDLISQGSLYRGEEHKHTLLAFQKLQHKYAAMATMEGRADFAWLASVESAGPVARIRNTSIGTLLIDLSGGLGLEQAVRKYEAVVAPANYQRPTALVTQSMIAAAKDKLESLGLISALERRFARLDDLSINDILFADRSARKVLQGDVFDSLTTRATSTKNLDKVEEVSIDLFIREIVPRAESIELHFESKHAGNLVSLIAPVDPTAKPLFKWDNRFSWAYNGDFADSIKERVKAAGGNITGEFLCRLAWHNFDDLDLHMLEPNRYEIYFGNKGQPSPNGGMLDVDMNAGAGTTRSPVENIVYASCRAMRHGLYTLMVRNYSHRDATEPGFEVEVDYKGALTRFAYPKALAHQGAVTVAQFEVTKDGITIKPALPAREAQRIVWGLKTQEFHRVNLLSLSPNYWSARPSGNKHYFFMLDGCVNDGTARGFYNEFLGEALAPHRKVLEMVGAKMQTEASPYQLSGLGFSSTQRNEVFARVKGAFTRTVKVLF